MASAAPSGWTCARAVDPLDRTGQVKGKGWCHMPALTAVVEDAKGADIVWIGDRCGCREIVLIDEDSIHHGLGVCNGNVPDKSDGAGTGRRPFLCRREIHHLGTRAERRKLANRHQGLVRHSTAISSGRSGVAAVLFVTEM